MGERLNAALSHREAADELTPDDVLALRRAMYEDGRIDAPEAQALLRLHRRGASNRADWADFLVEALADHFALQREVPDWGASYAPDYGKALSNVLRAASPFPGHKGGDRTFPWSGAKAPLDPGAVDALIAAFEAEGGLVLDAVERRVLTRLFDRAIDYPERLVRFAMEAVYESVRADGTVDAGEVELLRRLVYGPASDEGLVISRDEAEMLLALRAASTDGVNAPAWPGFFAKAVGAHVLMCGPATDVLDAAEAKWLADRLGDPANLDVAGRALTSHLSREARLLDPAFDAFATAA